MPESHDQYLIKKPRGGAAMPGEKKNVVPLNHMPFVIFGMLKERWEQCEDRNSTLHIKKIYEMSQKFFYGTGSYLSIQSIRNIMQKLEEENLVKRLPRRNPRGKGSAGIFTLNWEVAENSNVIERVAKKITRKATAKKSTPGVERENEDIEDLNAGENREQKEQQAPEYREPKKPHLRIMSCAPETQEKFYPGPHKRSAEEDFSSAFRILVTKDCRLGSEDFKDSAPQCALRAMFFEGSDIEVVFGENSISLIAHESMDCKLNGEEMETEREYVIDPEIPHLLTIDNFDYVVRALGFQS